MSRMSHEEFEKIFEETVDRCREVLVEKAYEYADNRDRLHNFRQAAAFNSLTPAQALWGMETKHLISLADMIRSGEDYSQALWDEKLGDALNYLFLLVAVIKDDKINRSQGNSGHKV